METLLNEMAVCTEFRISATDAIEGRDMKNPRTSIQLVVAPTYSRAVAVATALGRARVILASPRVRNDVILSFVAAAAGAAFRLVSLYRRASVGPGHRIRDQLRSTGRWRTVAPGRRSRKPGASCRQQSGPASEANSPQLARAVRPAFSAPFPRETDRVSGCLPQRGSTRRRVLEE